jgi:adenosylhomocysteine nucleosidase
MPALTYTCLAMIPRVVVVISADGEWRAIPQLFPEAVHHESPYGPWFTTDVASEPVVFFHGGWAKIPAAASTQYAISTWSPELLVNLGTCGGFEGEVDRDTVIMVDRTVDIINQMSDTDEVIARFTTEIDLGWVTEPPIPVTRATIVSGDRDLRPEDIPALKEKYGARVGDWESGSIAWVCRRNGIRLLILRGVSDLVGPLGGEAYGNKVVWVEAAERIMTRLVASLPGWIRLHNAS